MKKSDWRSDLEASRNLTSQEKSGFALVLGWYESWRLRSGEELGLESARAFWRAEVRKKEREAWQLEQWTEGIRWLLAWMDVCRDRGTEPTSLSERVYRAVFDTGARRGLALRTRQTYARWVARFAKSVGDEREVMNQEACRDWLQVLVARDGMSFSSQIQALNGLVFFYRLRILLEH